MSEKWIPKTAYAAKLRDPRWQKVRLQVMERDEFICQFCGDANTTLNVHHLFYVRGRSPWEYPVESLLTLCEPCHEAETADLKDSAEYLIHVLKTIGATSRDFDVLAQPFHRGAGRLPGPEDTWSVIAYGIKQIFDSLLSNDASWHELRERYYESLAAKKNEA